VALERLSLTNETVEVMLGGGLFRSRDPRLVGAIDRGLREVGPGVSARVTDSPPIVGAALLGLDEVGAGEEARGRLRSELGAAVDRFEQSPVVDDDGGLLAEAYLEVE
jgi:hypothetical protein